APGGSFADAPAHGDAGPRGASYGQEPYGDPGAPGGGGRYDDETVALRVVDPAARTGAGRSPAAPVPGGRAARRKAAKRRRRGRGAVRR
ncbi:class E sortase, partial [Streptomyces sp. TRM76130]|nr:class E sortase [Streptomyces sp. TRM76130]